MSKPGYLPLVFQQSLRKLIIPQEKNPEIIFSLENRKYCVKHRTIKLWGKSY